MNIDMDKLEQICKSRIDDGANLDDIKDFIVSKQNEDVYLTLEDNIKSYIDMKSECNEKNKLYWMLICNTEMWGEGTEQYEVNSLLYNLSEESIEPWKINQRTDMELQMKEGHRGIIKVSEDKRTKLARLTYEGEEIPLLQSGIYGIFEVIRDVDDDCTYENTNGDWFVNIKVIDNFYAQDRIIPKEKAIELLGKNIYNSIPSTKINKKVFENILNYQGK